MVWQSYCINQNYFNASILPVQMQPHRATTVLYLEYNRNDVIPSSFLLLSIRLRNKIQA